MINLKFLGTVFFGTIATQWHICPNLGHGIDQAGLEIGVASVIKPTFPFPDRASDCSSHNVLRPRRPIQLQFTRIGEAAIFIQSLRFFVSAIDSQAHTAPIGILRIQEPWQHFYECFSILLSLMAPVDGYLV